MITRISRRFRSASFRAGLITAFIVAAIVALPLLAGLATFSVETQVVAPDSVNSVTEAIEQGTNPAEVLDDLVVEPGELFVLIDKDGDIVQQVGDAPAVVRSDLADEKYRIDIDGWITSPESLFVGDVEWFIVNEEATAPDGTNYLFASAQEVQFSQLPLPIAFGVVAVLVSLMAGASGGMTAWVVRRSLRRVDIIQTEVQQISSKSLHRRLPTADIADPIDRLPHTMNAMLERLDEAQQQQAQFIADASHELRSPVAGILAQLEVALEYPDQVNVKELLPRLHADSVRTQGIIQDLLYLNRLEGGNEKKFDNLSVPDAVDLLAAEVGRFQSNSSKAEVSLDRSLLVIDSSEGVKALQLSASHFGRVIQNLVDNAIRHCEKRVVVRMWVDPPLTAGRQLGITVSDDGSGISGLDRDRVFSRFLRLDEARSRDKGGSGLGLAITKELTERAGGTIAVVDSANVSYPGATFEVRLPVVAA